MVAVVHLDDPLMIPCGLHVLYLGCSLNGTLLARSKGRIEWKAVSREVEIAFTTWKKQEAEAILIEG